MPVLFHARTMHMLSLAYAIQYHTFSMKFLGLFSGHSSASSAALPVQMSASLALTKGVRFTIFQPA